MKRLIAMLLRQIGLMTPNIRFIRAIPNLFLRPVHLALGLGGGVVDVGGFKMRLDPKECVDAALWFTPHLYDRKELRFLRSRFSSDTDGWFVDLGANIGFWSLCFASWFPRWSILSVEANPDTFQVLLENIAMNGWIDRITALQLGVSDSVGELPLYCNDSGNRGGDSFTSFASHRARRVIVPVKPLDVIFSENGVDKVNVLKIDIEGLESAVLSRFFSNAGEDVWPVYICAEVIHDPKVTSLLKSQGYRIAVVGRENIVFVRG